MKLKSVICAGVMALAVGVVSMNSAYAAVDCPAGSLRGDAGQPANSYAECNLPVEEEGDPNLMKTVMQILNVIVGVVGVIAVAVIIIGGILYVTSTGEAAKTTRARNTILYGIVGLVIALLAFAIVRFVLNNAFKTTTSGTPDTASPADPTGE